MVSRFFLFVCLFLNFVWLWVSSPPGAVTFGFIIAVILSALYQEGLLTCSCLLTHRNDKKKKSHTFVKSMLNPPWQNPCPSASIVATKEKKDRKEYLIYFSPLYQYFISCSTADTLQCISLCKLALLNLNSGILFSLINIFSLSTTPNQML